MGLKNFITRFKPGYCVYNMFKASELKHTKEQYKKLGLQKSYFSSVSSKDFSELPRSPNPLDVSNSRDVLPENEFFQTLDQNIQESLLTWSDKGYVILRGFVNEDAVNKINEDIYGLIEANKANWKFDKNRIMFALHQLDSVRNIGMSSTLAKIMEMLLGRDISLFQSINFIKGTQQKTHSDSIHMTTYPLGNLIAAWVALEDVGPDQGPLHYYPGSHKLPYVLNSNFDSGSTKTMIGDQVYENYETKIKQIIGDDKLEKEVLLAKKGDVLIWHANLLHGGEPQTNMDLTRKSMVFHYYAKDVVCYHELTQRPALIKPII